jgi:hypothetical protein
MRKNNMPCDKECCVVLITSVGLMMMLLHKEEGILYNDKILERLSASTKETITSQYNETTALDDSCNKASHTQSQLTNAVRKIAYQPQKQL